jgi:hypothetical protein
VGTKKITNKTNKKAKATNASSFVTLSSKQTTDSKTLKRLIKRKQKQNSVSHLFDQALPNKISLRGVLKPHSVNSKADVKAASDENLSPFVLELRTNLPSPEEIIENEEYNNIQLNFLSSHNARAKKPETNDLALSAHEANDQISESDWRNISDRNPQIKSSLETSQTQSVPFSLSPNFSSISINGFEPRELPKNFETFFDLPEQEKETTDTEEENIELLNQYLNQEDLEEEAEQNSPNWFPKFSFSVSLPQGWHKTIGAFVAISFIFVLPIHAMNVFDQLRELKNNSESIGQNAIASLESGAGATLNQDSLGAISSFSRAASEFTKAEDSIENLGTATSLILSSLPQTGKSYESAEALVEVGKSLSLAGEKISEGLLAIEQNPDPSPTSHLEILKIYLSAAYPNLVSANDALNKVSLDIVPEDQRDILIELKSKLPTLVTSSNEFISLFETIKTILGANGSKTYLLVFQNNTEIRPTGGFMGSFAELKVHNGNIEKLSIPGGGTYDLQGWLKNPLIAPRPLQLLKAKWEFQDANWFPDFPSSARQILQFYKNAGGPDIDGIVAINATYVSELIGLLGPIDMPEYGRTIDQENFLFETQKIVELEYDREENKPKAFIGDLAPKLIDRATNGSPELFLSLLDKVGSGLEEKDIQLYFENQDTQKVVVEKGWAGKIKQAEKDYFMLVNTNLGGGKTDGVISEKINLDVNISTAGEVTNTVTIKRTHNGIKGVVFTGRNNVNYARLYTPRGSELISGSGFSIPDDSLFEDPLSLWETDDDLRFTADTLHKHEETKTDIFEEQGKTVFGNWIQTRPGTTSTTTFTYKLPFTVNTFDQDETITEKITSFLGFAKTEKYSLTIQKQSGVIDRTTELKVNIPSDAKPLWSSHPEKSNIFNNKTDGFFALLLER